MDKSIVLEDVWMNEVCQLRLNTVKLETKMYSHILNLFRTAGKYSDHQLTWDYRHYTDSKAQMSLRYFQWEWEAARGYDVHFAQD